MKVFNHIYQKDTDWQPAQIEVNPNVQLVLCFGDPELLYNDKDLSIRQFYPNAQITGCTTAGAIFDTTVQDNCMTLTAIEFEKTDIHVINEIVFDEIDSTEIGKKMASQLLEKQGLKHVLVLADGLLVKGDDLSVGLSQTLPQNIAVTGGMAGQGTEFEDTRVWLQDSGPMHQVVVIGLYGDDLEIGYGSQGGFDTFGPKRKITRSDDNILYELDGQSALELYKTYLGDDAKELPSSGLHFPLMLTKNNLDEGVVRTIQGINEQEQSMKFAGALPEGAYVQLMKSSYDSLIDGAFQAAEKAGRVLEEGKDESDKLAFLVSCVGRRVVLNGRIDEELEDVKEVLGGDCTFTGFYSYGEFCPIDGFTACVLHNQTMTITTFRETL